MTAVFVGSDFGPEALDDPIECLRARADGYQPTCGQLDHCPTCQLCSHLHPRTCEAPVKNLSTVAWTSRCNDDVRVDLDQIGEGDRTEFMVNVAVAAPIHLDEVDRLIADLQDAVTAAKDAAREMNP